MGWTHAELIHQAAGQGAVDCDCYRFSFVHKEGVFLIHAQGGCIVHLAGYSVDCELVP